MTDPLYDVLGIGNAIFDILSHVEEDLLVRENLAKGSMRLVDAGEIDRLYEKTGASVRASGGSAGNTVAGVASLGGKAAFIGKVADDSFGEAYTHDMRGIGVAFGTPPLRDGVPTASCLVLVSPDGERTMNTYLGASQWLSADDIDHDLVAQSAVTFLEGYLFDPPPAKSAFRNAAATAKENGRLTAITLSDTFCVDRHRDDFLDFMRSGSIDLVFANEHELRALFETSDFDGAVGSLRELVPMAVVTMGAEGALVVERDATERVRAFPVEQVVDLTGAGDVFAGGFLFGLARGLPLVDCARIGTIGAAEVIQHIGARPQARLADLIRQEGYAV